MPRKRNLLHEDEMNNPSSPKPTSPSTPYASGQVVEVDLSDAHGDASYNIIIGESILSEAGTLINVCLGKRNCMIVTDDNVGTIYRERLEANLAATGHKV